MAGVEGTPAAAPKVSFGGMKLKGPPKRKPAGVASQPQRPADDREEIVAIGSKGIQSAKPQVKVGPKVIAPQGNSWQLHGKRKAVVLQDGKSAEGSGSAPAQPKKKTLDEEAMEELVRDAKRLKGEAEEGDNDEERVIEGGGITETASGSQLGAKLEALEAAKVKAIGGAGKGGNDTQTNKDTEPAADVTGVGVEEPDLTAAAGPVSEDDKFRADVAWRPTEAAVDSEAWAAMPIKSFGTALLRGMGWKPGKAIGLNAKGPATAVEYVPRHHRLGLGAQPKAPEPKRKGWINKPGEARGPKPDMIYRDEHGVQKHRKTVEEKLVEREKLGMGSVVAVVGGKHEGIRGVLRSMSEMSGVCTVRARNDEDLSVALRHVILLSQLDNFEASRAADGSQAARSSASSRSGKHKKEKKEKREKHKKHKKSSHHGANGGGGGGGGGSELWVATGLRVRIVSQSVGGGRFYMKKGVVQDVQSKRSCLVLLDGGEGALGQALVAAQ
jgi:hypothetical protein